MVEQTVSHEQTVTMAKAIEGFKQMTEALFDLELGPEWRVQQNELSGLPRVKEYWDGVSKMELTESPRDLLTIFGI